MTRLALSFAVLGIVFAASVRAEQTGGLELSAASAKQVSAVHYVGLGRVDLEAVSSRVHTRVKKPFDPDEATQDLRRLWGSGFFRDVKVLLEEDDFGVSVTFEVVEKPTIRAVIIRGRDAISEDDVKGVVDVKANTIHNPALIERNVQKIRDLYIGKGYFLADVTAQQRSSNAQGDIEIIFDIVEHAKVVVKQITFVGNHALSREVLETVMQTRVGNELSFLTQAGTYKEEFLQADVMRIQSLYFDRGFVSVKIEEPRATLSPDRKSIYLTLQIDEGLRYDVGALSFGGDVLYEGRRPIEHVDAETLSKKVTLKKGETFNRTRLFENMQAMTDVYRDLGFAYANVTPNSRLNADARVVDIEFEVERGQEVTFDKIEMSGNLRTRDKVLRRELAIFEGERFSQSAVNLSRARIYQLGFFETVEISTAQGSRPDLMNVTVEVKEKSTGTFQIGAGFSSYERFIATAQISQNNFLGRGQSLSLSAQLSFGAFARQLATFQFYEPYFLDSQWSLSTNAYLNQRFYRDFQRNARGISPSLGYPLTHELRLSAGYTFEDVEITTKRSDVESVLHNLNRNGLVSSFHADITYDSRDNRLFPTRGQYHDARFEISAPWLGASDALAFKRLEGSFRLYQPLVGSLVFRTNFQVGWVFGSPLGMVPMSERYFPGGIYSVRGFSPRSLGPSLRVAHDTGEPDSATREFGIGGNKQLILNIEVEFSIMKSAGVKGVVFFDAGNAYDDDEGFFYAKTPRVQHTRGFLLGTRREVDLPIGLFPSFGFGVRWFSPIGPLRFEWGIPIVRRQANDRNLVFEFTIGNFF